MYYDFEWDENKNQLNQLKHGISFAVAAAVFEDSNVLTAKDRVKNGEQRWHAIGLVEDAVLMVVHCYRKYENGKETIRIISARAASKRERRKYQEASLER